MATYSIKVLKDGRTLTRKQVTKGFVKTETAIIQAGADQAYVVSDALAQDKAPTKLQTRRVGQDLHVSFGDSSVAAPDLIIEGYFNFPSAPILGTLSDGSNALYDMSQILSLAQSSAASTNPVPTATRDSAAAPSALQDPQPYAGFSGLQLAGGLALGALALAGGKSGGGSEPTAAEAAQTKISTFAADNTKPIPVVADYAALGVSGVTAANVGAINSAVIALPASEINGVFKLQAVVDASLKILAEANGTTADATPGNNPTAADYAAIGAAIGAASSGIANLSLLNDVLGNKVSTDVDTIAEINALASAVNAVMAGAAGGTVPSAAQLSLLGLTGVNADNLATVQAGIAATLDSGSGVDSLSKLQAIVNASTSQSAIGNYAASNLNPVPTLSDYTQLGVTGVTAGNLAAINSAVDALDAPAVNSVTKAQAVVDTYIRILAEANGTTADATPGNNPTAADYAAIGAAIGAASSGIANLSLLNDVLGNKVSTDVDTIAEINALASAVNAVMAGAAGGTVPSAAQLSLLGLTGVNADNLATVQAGIAATLDSGSGVDSLSKLQAIVNASTSQSAIGNYAASNLNPVPTLSDYTQLGVTGVTAGNLAAINSAVDALDAPAVNSVTKAQAVVDTYIRILAEANGTTADATPGNNPTAADYAAIGAAIGAASSGIANLSLLNDVLGNKVSTDVDTIAEINALASAVNAVMAGAAGGTVPSAAQLSLLGLTGVNADNLATVQAGIAATLDSGSGVDSLSKLQAIVNASTSQSAIGNYAASNLNPVPTLSDYTQLGVTGVTAGNLAAINSAVDALDAPAVNSVTKAQAVVDTYIRILAEANGTTADATPGINPAASDYARIGANIGLATSNTYALSLLGDIVGGLNSTAVDSVSEINGLASVVDRIMNVAAGASGSLAVNDFSTIGIATSGAGAVTGINLTAVIDAIANSGGQSHVASLQDLQNLVSSVATIVSYSDSNTQAAPTLTTYSNAGLNGVTSVNLLAINSAIDANAPSGVDTKGEMQAVIDSYIAILAEANGATPDATPTVNPSAAQYAVIGAAIGSAASDSESLALLNNVISGLNISSVDTVAEINALAATVDKIMNLAGLATGSAVPAGAPTMVELTALGLNTTLANTAAEQTAIWQAIIDSANSGVGVTTILQLQALIDANAS